MLACLLLAGCVTNNLSTQNAQIVPAGGGVAVPSQAAPLPAPRPAQGMTSTARLMSASMITVRKTTTSGATLLLANLHSLNPDCTPIGPVEARIATPPAHGTVHIAMGTAFPSYVPGDPPYACNSRRLPATLISYQPTPGFTGQDVAVVETFFPSGRSPSLRFEITVR